MASPDHHVFISFSSRDKVKATSICERLESVALRCWISHRDVDPGSNYQASIVEAIQSAKVMVLVFSENTNESQEVHKETSLASAFRCIVIPVRIVDVAPRGALLYELATRQWVDAFEDWEPAMVRLVATVRASLERGGSSATSTPIDGPVTTMAALVSPIKQPDAAPQPKVSNFSSEQLNTARIALAFYVGPIADLLVRKASANATSLADLHTRLAAHVPVGEAQRAFRQRLKA